MNRGQENGDSIARIASDLAMRIRWERENGCPGYPRGGALPAPAADRPDPDAALRQLREAIGECTRCPLHEGRRSIVFGEGSPTARLAFVGEGPGRDEDLSGRPFVGAAGQLLDRIIAAIKLKREEVYICNVVKCRPPDNRTPKDEECAVCGVFLKQQLAIVNPRAVVALGSTAARFLLGRSEPVGKLRGRFHEAGGFRVMPTYHPAFLLRSPENKRPVWEDMQAVAAALGPSGSGP